MDYELGVRVEIRASKEKLLEGRKEVEKLQLIPKESVRWERQKDGPEASQLREVMHIMQSSCGKPSVAPYCLLAMKQ